MKKSLRKREDLTKITANNFSISSILIGAIVLISPWATYTQFYFLVTPATISSILLVLFYIFYFIFNKKDIKFFTEDSLIALFLVPVGIGYFASLDPKSWGLAAFWYAICISTYLASKPLLKNTSQLKFISYFGAAGIYTTFLLISPTVNEYGIVLDRQSVPDHNSNFTSYCLSAIIFIIMSNLILNRNNLIQSLLFHTSIITAIYCILLLGTRAAIISCILLYIALFTRSILKRSSYRMFTFASVAISAATATGQIEAMLLWIDTFSERSDGELSGRSPSWDVARAYFLDHPLLGIGPGAFNSVNPLQVGAHNTVLKLALDTGLMGLVIFFAWLSVNFANIKLEEPLKSRIAVLWMAYALPISLSGEWIQSPIVWVTFAVLFGLRETASPARQPS